MQHETSEDIFNSMGSGVELPTKMNTPEHPFVKTLGAGPYEFIGISTSPHGISTKCKHCGTAIKNVYSIRTTANGLIHSVGSECILKIAHQDTRSLVARVKRQKNQYEKLKRETRAAEKRTQLAKECRAESLLTKPEECAWLESYDGNFSFYLSLKKSV